SAELRLLCCGVANGSGVRGRDAREILVVLQQQAVITSPGTIKAAAADVTAPVTSMLLVHVRPLP
ncbi:MAG: hypothetical protein WAO08_22585, partial [Hyphomicrobiaceae bacterium]